MAVFTTESRMKEISIRKVLGAGVDRLTFLLSKSFLLMIIIAAFIAIPLGHYIVNEKLLADFEQKAHFGVLDLLSGFLLVLIMAALTIGWQLILAIRKNPADTLRAE
jgi:ABC-type antimicrobial peptide transport system permease subunit